MHRRHLLLLLSVALTLGLLLPRGDAAPEPVPGASRAPCCNVADAPPPPVSSGDDDFFTIASGVPNVMILLDNSGSMTELPRQVGSSFPIDYPASLSSTGSCALPSTSPLERLSAARTATPYDAGYTTYDSAGAVALRDAPPWTTACSTTPAPTSDRVNDPCLFRATSYYKFVRETPVGMGIAGATVFNATPATTSSGAPTANVGPCAGVDGNGWTSWFGLAETAARYSACMTCLRTKGYFVFNDGSFGNQAVIRGDLLNVYPDNPLVSKAITARKLIKDTIKLDPQSATTADVVRFGLAVTTGSDANTDCDGSSISTRSSRMRGSDGARLLVPIGPDCTAAANMTQSQFVAARQQIIDAINNTTPSAQSCTGFVDFNSFTPPGEALFNIGQYFAAAGTSSVYRSRFGSQWMKESTSDPSQDFSETSAGAVNAPWAAGGNQRSFCFACQQSSVLLITDGMPTSDGNVPSSPTPATHDAFNNDFRSWVRADGSFTSGCSNCSREVLHKVAAFLNTTDLRPDFGGTELRRVKTYTVSFGIDPVANASAVALLNKTAELGGTVRAHITNSDTELKAALDQVIKDVEQRMTSFSAPSASALQGSQSTGPDAYLPRFKPTGATLWEGHLYAAGLFDEFGQDCDETLPPASQRTFACGSHANTNPDLDGDTLSNGNARCRSTYLVDADCDPIASDARGLWKGAFDPKTHALGVPASPAPLRPFWDAGTALSDPSEPTVVANHSYRSAEWAEDSADVKARKRWIWTVIDRNADGFLTAADGLVEFQPDNAAALAPMMNLPAAAQTSSTALPAVSGATPWCNSWLDQIGVCGRAPLPSCGTTEAEVRTMCARQIIHFYRGWDLEDRDGDKCAGPDSYVNTHPWGSCTNDDGCRLPNGALHATCVSGQCAPVSGYCPDGEQRDRSADHRTDPAKRDMWKLGDIFHSSPVLVRPPYSKPACLMEGLYENQCLITLFGGAGNNRNVIRTPLDLYGNVDAYDQWRTDNLRRPQFVLVGANDGMLHAFHAGDPTGTPSPYAGYAHDPGTGAELWAFIPPDLLPRLRQGIQAHTTFVDGSPMVRDIWVDGSGGNPKDGKKQKGEFHTIAVISERGGGQRFTALDVTQPTAPAFLWTWPQPCSAESKLVGQTWSEFAPGAPPIGPVRLKLPTSSAQDPRGRGFEERWVVTLNGGYDPALVRGRGVFMVDAWTGADLWSFTDADLKALRGDDKAGLFPVPGAVAMVDIGAATTSSAADSAVDSDGFFDTATWADMGGNLYTARFFESGVRDPISGRVTNWYAARAFEQQRQTDDVQRAQGRGPFFSMPASVLDGPSRLLSIVGSGDRENLLLKTNACGTRNVLGCCATGCSGSAATATSYGAGSCSQGGTFACTDGVMRFTAATTSSACASATGFTCGAAASPAVNAQTDVSVTCGTSGSLAATSRYAYDANGLVTLDAPVAGGATIEVGAALPRNRMFGIWAYGKVPTRRFATVDEARAFDANRATDVDLTGCTDMPGRSCRLVETSSASFGPAGVSCRDGTTTCWAQSEDPGWMYSYGTYCPLESCATKTWTDERSAGITNVAVGCAFWSTMRPDAGSTARTVNPCQARTNGPVALGYYMDAYAGVPREHCGVEHLDPAGRVASISAARQRDTLAAPQGDMLHSSVNQKGEQRTSGSQGDGSSDQTLDQRSVSELIYWLEVDRSTHVCRHVDPTTCK